MQPEVNMIASIAKKSMLPFAFVTTTVFAQSNAPEPPKVEVVTSIESQQWIGISPISRNTIWVSGVDGRVARSTDAGFSWTTHNRAPAICSFVILKPSTTDALTRSASVTMVSRVSTSRKMVVPIGAYVMVPLTIHF